MVGWFALNHLRSDAMDPRSYLTLASILCMVFLSAFIYGQRRRNRVNRAFFVFSLFCIFLILNDFILRTARPGPAIDLLIGTQMLFLFASSFSFLHFVYALVGRQIDGMYRTFLAFSVSGFALSLLWLPLRWGYVPELGTFSSSPSPQFVITFLIGNAPPAVTGFLLLAAACFRARPGPHEKSLRIVLVGTVLTLVFILITAVIIPLVFKTQKTVHLSSIGVVVFGGFVYGAVIRHNFLSLNIMQIEDTADKLFADSTDAIFLLAPEGSVAQFNDAALELIGVSGDNFSADTLSEIIEGYRFDQDYDHHETKFVHAGSERIVAITQRKLRGADETVSKILSITDITESRRNEMEAHRLKQYEALGVFAGGIAHDFNNCLSGISTGIGLLKMSVMVDEESEELFELLQKGIRQASALSRQLITFSRGDSLEWSKVNFKRIVEDAVRLAIKGTNVKLRTRIAEDLPEIWCDRSKIVQVLSNLALNSIQAMNEKGTILVEADLVELSKDETPAGLNPGTYLQVYFHDSGPGVPPDIKDKVFDPYFSKKTAGSGLGLAVCYSVVQKHNGRIAVMDIAEPGAHFSILLPIARPEEAREESVQLQDSLPESPGAETPRPTVLIMDDDPTVRLFLSRVLAKLEYEVLEAEDGDRAWEIYAKQVNDGRRIDAVITDLMVRGAMNGIGLTYRILEKNPTQKIIVSSAYCDDSALTEWKQHGFCAALKKPYSLEQLRQTLQETIGSRRNNHLS